MKPDVIVVGLGAMGSQTLWRLARRGIPALGLEQFSIAHHRGASHGGSRIIRTAYREGAAYVPLLQESWRMWTDLEQRTRTPLLTRTGGLLIGHPDTDAITGPIASAEAHGLAYKVLAADEVRAAYPQHRISDDLVGFFEHDAGVLHPERAVTAAIEAATAAGAQIWPNTHVLRIEPDSDRPAVYLSDGTVLTARHVVVAGGGWLPRLVPSVRQHLRVVRRVVGWFAPRRSAPWTPEQFPIFIRADRGGRHNWYGFPADRDGVKLGLHVWPGIDEEVDPEIGVRPADTADATRLGAVVADTLPGLDPTPRRLLTCMYSLTPDEHFVVGGRREAPGLTLLGGFSGHGFKLAPVIGEIAAQYAATGESDLAPGIFDPHRFDPVGYGVQHVGVH